MVPAVFRPWALDLVRLAAPLPGERVLDLACGTGVVARLAADALGGAGRDRLRGGTNATVSLNCFMGGGRLTGGFSNHIERICPAHSGGGK